MLFGLLSFVVWSNQKTKNNTIWRHRDCNAKHSWMCLCLFFFEIVVVSTMVKTKKSHHSPAVFPIISSWPYLLLDAPGIPKPKRPTIQPVCPNLFVSQGTVAISCVNFIVVPVPRSESVRWFPGWWSFWVGGGFDEFGGVEIGCIVIFGCWVVWMVRICVVEIEVETLPF